MEIEVNKIKPDPEQPRKTFNEESLQFLAESILGNGLITPIDIDGERRWRAHKLAKLKTISVRVVTLKKDKIQRLKRQLISDLLDEKVKTEESYPSIVKLWKVDGSPTSMDDGVEDWCHSIGISQTTLTRARNWVKDKKEKPELTEGISAGVWREVRNLPEEEIKEIKKELEETDEPFKKIVEQKKEQIKERKEREKIEQELEESRKEMSKKDIKIRTDNERMYRMQQEIIQMRKDRQRFYADIKWMGRTKFYLNTPKQKDSFIRFLDGESQEARNWADKLDGLKENIEIDIIKE